MADRRFTDVELERSLAGDLPAARAQLVERDATDADRARLAELRANARRAALDRYNAEAQAEILSSLWRA